MRLQFVLPLTLALKRFRECRDGTAAIEFAFVAPVFFMMMFGILEFSMLLLATALLENAVSDAARFGLTGFSLEGVSREQTIRDTVAERTQGMLDPDQITITSTVYEHFDDIGQPEPYIDANSNGQHDTGETYTDINGNGTWDNDMGTAGAGGAGDIVVYTVEYDWPLMVPGVSHVVGNEEGKFPISARIVVRNEPYDYANQN